MVYLIDKIKPQTYSSNSDLFNSVEFPSPDLEEFKGMYFYIVDARDISTYPYDETGEQAEKPESLQKTIHDITVRINTVSGNVEDKFVHKSGDILPLTTSLDIQLNNSSALKISTESADSNYPIIFNKSAKFTSGNVLNISNIVGLNSIQLLNSGNTPQILGFGNTLGFYKDSSNISTSSAGMILDLSDVNTQITAKLQNTSGTLAYLQDIETSLSNKITNNINDTDTSKVLNLEGLKTELNKKLNLSQITTNSGDAATAETELYDKSKTDSLLSAKLDDTQLVTEISDNLTDEQILSAKAVNDELKSIKNSASSTYVKKSGDTMTGQLVAPSLKTNDATDSYVYTHSIIGEGDNTNYYHRIDVKPVTEVSDTGPSYKNAIDFYEYSGNFNFYQNQSSGNSAATELFKITPEDISIKGETLTAKLDKKIDKANIVTEIADPYEDDKVPSEKAVYNYVDSNGGKLKNALSATVTVGGVAIGKTYVAGTPLETILRDILSPYVHFNLASYSASPNGGTYEKGNTQNVTKFTVGITAGSLGLAGITNIKIKNNSTGEYLVNQDYTAESPLTSSSVSFTLDTPEEISTNTSFNVQVTEQNNGEVSWNPNANFASFNFIYPHYHGSTTNGSIEESYTSMTGFTKHINTTGTFSWSFTTPTSGDSPVILVAPGRRITQILNSLQINVVSNFTTQSVKITGLDGTEQTYTAYIGARALLNNYTYKITIA